MYNLEHTENDYRKIVTGDNARLENIRLGPEELGAMNLTFNFLTKEVTGKTDFTYHAMQLETGSGHIIGGETYLVHRDGSRNLFLAETSQTTAQNDSITYSANTIGEPATYNWYDPEGNLIWSGPELRLHAGKFGKYKLEVIAGADGYKDYKELEIHSPFSIESISPNPATGQVSVKYEIGTGNAAYLMLTNINSTISNNYILDEAQNEILLDISGFPPGTYVVSLVIDGQIVDSENLVIQ